MLCFIYICICQLYTFLFLANVRAQDAAQWLESTAVSLLQEGRSLFLGTLLELGLGGVRTCC